MARFSAAAGAFVRARPVWRACGPAAALAALALLPGLGSASRLTYHEAFVGQGAREMLESGDWGSATIGGRPWLEKPPLPWWLAAASAWCAGGATEAAVRLPSALAAIGLALGASVLAARRCGPTIGLLAGLVQATTAWTVERGRLAEADLLLACLTVWAILAFDRLRSLPGSETAAESKAVFAWRGVFFGLLGATSLVKGIGFGAVLILGVVGTTVVLDRDRAAWNRLRSPAGWIAAALIALAWPLAMIARHGLGALGLWTLHVTDRLAARPAHFAGESWPGYVLGIMLQGLPWTPWVVVGAWGSLGRALAAPARNRRGPAAPSIDRLLWIWGSVPLLLLSLATVKNAHYAVYAQIPWSIWGAFGLSRTAERLRRRGWSERGLRRLAAAGFVGLGLVWGFGFRELGPWFDRRGVEWAFYESAAGRIPPGLPAAFLYDDWDRDPYPTPFGPIPHDLAVRLYYLNRPACWHFDPEELAECRRCASAGSRGRAVIGRERDRKALERLGRVEVLAEGPPVRSDRTYQLMRLSPGFDLESGPGLGFDPGSRTVRR